MDNGNSLRQETLDDMEHGVSAGVMAAFLRVGKQVDHASSLMLIGIFLLNLKIEPGFAAVTLFLGFLIALAEKYFAWRVALDADLFSLLQRFPQESAAFDAALAQCSRRAKLPAGRSLNSRWQGACRLLKCQLLACLFQAATLVAVFLNFLGAS